jgi:putative hydrolase of the HAD superfamily
VQPETVLLLDYAGVVSLHQSDEARSRLVMTAGADADRFWSVYWALRRPYDAGSLSANEYWDRVAKKLDLVWSDERSAELVRQDTQSWLRPNREVLEIVAAAGQRGMRLAILSNAPKELAEAVRRLEWMRPFTELLFSCELGLTKPDPECYTAAVAQLGVAAGEVLFVDDRPENVAGAESAGLRAMVFQDERGLRNALNVL